MTTTPSKFSDFSDLFDPADQSQAVDMVGRIFGDIVSLVQGNGVEYSTWLNSLVEMFNFAGLFGVIVVTLYTVLTVFFDSAKDGKPFGNQADTRYTMMRVLSGAVAFIPVKAGFSIAQLILIWLVIQGSALGDRAWKLVADQNLTGSSFIGASRFERPGASRYYGFGENSGIDMRVRVQMGEAFDALVTGFLCQKSLNTIYANLNGKGSVATNSPVAFRKPSGPTTGLDENFWTDNQIRSTHAMYFYDTSNGYAGSRQLCGGVSRSVANYVKDEKLNGYNVNRDYFEPLRRSLIRAEMNGYHTAMLGPGGLVTAAESVANDIWNGAATDVQIRKRSIDAVDAARMTFVTRSSDAAESIYTDARLGQVMTRLRDKVTMDGWVMAAAWQRGLSLAAAQARREINFAELDLDITKESNVGAFIAPTLGLAAGTQGAWANGGQLPTVVGEQLKAMQAAQTRWAAIAPAVMTASRGAEADAPTSILRDGAGEMQGWVGSAYSMVMNALAVREPEDAYNDPMVDVQEFGEGMMQVGAGITAAGWGASIMAGKLPVVGDALSKLITPIGYGFLAIGFAATALIPMIPIVYFYSAVISWLILIVESMFALPLAILSLFTPSRDGTLIGSWNRILLSIFGIFLRPLFTVAGLLFGMLLIAVALDFSNALFQSMLGILTPSGTFSNLVTMLGVVLVSTFVTFYTVMLGSSMITEIGDGAMSLFGIGLSQVGGRMNVGAKMERGMGEAAMPTGLMPGNRPNMLGRGSDGKLMIGDDLKKIGNGAGGAVRRVGKFLPGPKP